MAELVASVFGIISVGTKVTLVLFQVASDLGSAGEDVRWLGTEISVFCAVLDDLKSTLERATASGFSLDSLTSMRKILDHCKEILGRIQTVVEKLTKQSVSENAQKLNYVARVKWVFSKGKVDCLRTKLESSKLTLSVMMTGFNWAFMLEQKQQGEGTNLVEERQNDLFQSLLISQQFLVQRLEQLERDATVVATPGHDEDELIPSSGISRTLNSAIFDDGMDASERQLKVEGSSSSGPHLNTLGKYSKRFQGQSSRIAKTTSESSGSSPPQPDPTDILPSRIPRLSNRSSWNTNASSVAALAATALSKQTTPPALPSSILATVVFKPITPSKHHSHFKKEPYGEQTTTIELSGDDSKSTIKDKAFKKFCIPYANCHYDLHLDSHGSRGRHIETWDSWTWRDFNDLVARGAQPELSVQNTLWEVCRNDPAACSFWKQWTVYRE